MKRFALPIAVVAAIGLFVGLLSACGNDGSEKVSSSEKPASEDNDSGMGMMDSGTMGHDMDMSGEGDSPTTRPPAEGAREVSVTARSFAFEPAEIEAEVGEELAVTLTAEDISHDFVIDELNVHIQADLGSPETGGVRADEAGEYTWYCSVPGHRTAGMKGTLTVA